MTVSDVTRCLLVRLPWDYASVYGLDPDKTSVADAVRASMSIPFISRPVTLAHASTKVTSTLVDGGLLSNFPIDSLDRTDGRAPRWPTFGVTLLPNLPAGDDKVVPLLALPVPGGVHLLQDVIAAMLVGRDQGYLNEPRVSARPFAWTRPRSASWTSGSPPPRPGPCLRRVTRPRRPFSRLGTGRHMSNAFEAARTPRDYPDRSPTDRGERDATDTGSHVRRSVARTRDRRRPRCGCGCLRSEAAAIIARALSSRRSTADLVVAWAGATWARRSGDARGGVRPVG